MDTGWEGAGCPTASFYRYDFDVYNSISSMSSWFVSIREEFGVLYTWAPTPQSL